MLGRPTSRGSRCWPRTSRTGWQAQPARPSMVLFSDPASSWRPCCQFCRPTTSGAQTTSRSGMRMTASTTFAVCPPWSTRRSACTLPACVCSSRSSKRA
eukprot:5744977-Lingulodinium_polyedra.AAC.1